MSTHQAPPTPSSSAPNMALYKQLKSLWGKMGYIKIGAAIGLLCAALILLTAVPKTRASLMLAPAQPLGDNALIPTSAQNLALIKAIASSAGAGNTDAFDQFIATISSAATAKALLSDPKIINGLRADKNWRIAPAISANKWTPQRLSDYITKRIRIIRHGMTSMKTLQYWHSDPTFATYFLSQLHALTDSAIKAQEKSRAQQRAAYLQDKITRIQNSEHKQILTQLFLEQERILMFTSIDQPFAANIAQAAQSHYKAQWPPIALIIMTCLAIGLAAGGLMQHAQNVLCDRDGDSNNDHETYRNKKGNKPKKNASRTLVASASGQKVSNDHFQTTEKRYVNLSEGSDSSFEYDELSPNHDKNKEDSQS